MKLRNKRSTDLNQYWASLPTEEFLSEAHGHIRDYYDDLQETGLHAIIDKSYRYYYGGDESGAMFRSAMLARQGRAGEIAATKLNHFRNVLKHTLQLTTTNKPAYQARAINSDYKSQAQTVLANGLLDYYLREKKLTRFLSQATENALVTSEGWIHLPWAPELGKEYAVGPDGNPIYEGDVKISVHHALDVVRDIGVRNEDDHKWLIVRNSVNKWELVAAKPEHRDIILANAGAVENDYESFDSFNFSLRPTSSDESDFVTHWTFYHLPTAAMPKGRLVEFVGNLALYDGPTPYEKIPLFKIAPDKLMGTCYSYTPAFELLGPQQALDITNSIIMSNNAAFGVQSIWTQTGDIPSTTTISSGLRHMQSQVMPQPVQLTSTAAETYNYRQSLIGEIETLSGISSTVRGNPEASLKSGSALALVVSQSIQFASLLEQSYNALLEDVGSCIIDHLKTFSFSPRTAIIVGNYNRSLMKTFVADDLAQVGRVVVEQTNSLAKTVSGKLEIATQLLDKGLITDPRQYIAILQTGQLDSVLEGTQSQLLNIRAENEALSAGEEVVPVVTEDHALHIKEHKTLLENPEAKKNPELVNAVLAHIQSHLDTWRTADPAILMITGQQPPPPSALPGPPPPPPGAPSGVTPVMEAPHGIPGQEQPRTPNMPNLPPNAPPEAQAAYEQLK